VKNKSLQVLNLTGCNLQPESVLFIAKGMAVNTCLHRLILNENINIGKESLAKLCDALLENKNDCKLVDLELSKCAITSESAKHLSKLLNSKIKLRHLNLRDNSIQDDAACEILGALINLNFYLTRVNMEFNPIKHQILRDIEAQTKLNVMKVNEQEIPVLMNEITDVKARTAGLLHDCSVEPLLKPKLQELFDDETIDAFKRMSVKMKIPAPGRHQPTQNRMAVDGISKAERKALYNGKMFSSYEIVQLYTYMCSMRGSL